MLQIRLKEWRGQERSETRSEWRNMMSMITNEELKQVRDAAITQYPGQGIRAWMIKEMLQKLATPILLDESTIRGRFISMGEPLSGLVTPIKPKETPTQDKPQSTVEIKPVSKGIEKIKKVFTVPDELKPYIPLATTFADYIKRPIDDRLAVHYDSSRAGCFKYPITQGKQGTGKTMGHMFYAFRNQLPFFLYSCHEDFKLHKLFGDKTIVNGTIQFKEDMLVKAIQHPSVILFDEVNYVSNENSVDFHAFLQNRELFVKDSNKVYKLHDDCKVGFAQNPKSAKYIGGNIKPSNFLGRCTFLTYPEFSKKDITNAIKSRFPNLVADDVKLFVEFYFACVKAIEQANIPCDVSIRQLNNVIDLYNHGLTLEDAIEDGLSSMMEAISQPASKEAFFRIAQAIWKELLNKSIDENAGVLDNFMWKWR